jgi:hypothetical protein
MPGAAAVAAADVHGHHVFRAVHAGNGGVVGLDVLGQGLVRIDADGPPLVPAVVGDVVRVMGIVDLDIRNALRRQGLNL